MVDILLTTIGLLLGGLIGWRIARGVAASQAGGRAGTAGICSRASSSAPSAAQSYVMVNTVRYARAGYINGRTCANDRYVRRDKLEAALLADIKAGLLDPDVIVEIERRVRQALRSRRKDDSARRIAKLEAEVGHLVAAIGESMMSPALRQRLQTAEAALERLRSAPKPASVEILLPRLPALIRAHVHDLARLAEREPVRARAAVRQALDTDAITIRPAEAGRHVVAEYGLMPVRIATGTESESVVAGACY
jgi:hypothetical protein